MTKKEGKDLLHDWFLILSYLRRQRISFASFVVAREILCLRGNDNEGITKMTIKGIIRGLLCFNIATIYEAR